MNNSTYVQYGCGISAPKEWTNFDVSPTLRIQKIPILGKIFAKKLNVKFPANVKYGDIISGLPVKENYCDGVYCSHTLEHLALTDFRVALKNTYSILKPGGIFRCIVPDLEQAANTYLKQLELGNHEASLSFLNATLLGKTDRPKKLKEKILTMYGNSNHLWMWDHSSLEKELKKTGFKNIRKCRFNDSEDPMFKLVEDEGRFIKAVALESVK